MIVRHFKTCFALIRADLVFNPERNGFHRLPFPLRTGPGPAQAVKNLWPANEQTSNVSGIRFAEREMYT
jgi:hypothetical protein